MDFIDKELKIQYIVFSEQKNMELLIIFQYKL